MATASTPIRPDTVVRRTADHLSADLGGGETVVMGVEQGMYYGLDEVASRVWALIAEPVAVAALCDRLVAEYEVDRDACERDVIAYLEALKREGLIESVDGTAR